MRLANALLLLVVVVVQLASCRQPPAGQLRQPVACPDGYVELTAGQCVQHGTAQGAPEPRNTGFRPVRRRPALGASGASGAAGESRRRTPADLLRNGRGHAGRNVVEAGVTDNPPGKDAHDGVGATTDRTAGQHTARHGSDRKARKQRRRERRRRKKKRRQERRRLRKANRRRAGKQGTVGPAAANLESSDCPTWVDRRGRCRRGNKKDRKGKKRGRGRKRGRQQRNRAQRMNDRTSTTPAPIIAFADSQIRLLTPLKPQPQSDGGPPVAIPQRAGAGHHHTLHGSSSQPQARRRLPDNRRLSREECPSGSTFISGGLCIRCRVRSLPPSGGCLPGCGQASGRCVCCTSVGEQP